MIYKAESIFLKFTW